ncbi:aspartyl/asparaginyl beta-hydroxylase domain-containing protein [Sphingosinicellaceae bacterium]|nr:aspartyl/asparaginyl beta-hydroxylase domain-containing protein [Sphingosinicellaceae bacterium]
MRLSEPLLRLPIAFDVEAMAAEVRALPAAAWVPHPSALPGNAAVRLVTTNGQMSDATAAPMAPTAHLRACPYITEVMAAIGAVWGRSRLMRLAPGAVVPPHIDTHFYWRTHVRLHVPIITTPDVLFTCAGETVHMAAGECWVFDTFSSHRVRNGGASARVHLVLDTVGGEGLWDLIEAARAAAPGTSPERRVVVPTGSSFDRLSFERTNTASLMSPWELRYHVDFLIAEALPGQPIEVVARRLDRLVAGWAGAWARYGSSNEGASTYRELLVVLEADLPRLGGAHLLLRNGLTVDRQIAEIVFTLNAALPPVVGVRAATH